MNSNEVLQKFFKKHGTKQLAESLKLSAPFLYKWCQPDGGKAAGGWNPVERVAALSEATQDDALLIYLCRRAGGEFVRESELPSFMLRWRARLLAQVKRFLQREASERQPGGARCRYRLEDRRCGYPLALRN